MKKLLMGMIIFGSIVAGAEVQTAEIGFAGYTGNETLTDFPALIKLPDAVEGFTYADAGDHGEQLWFTDAGGNVLAHEVDHWDANGKSYVWVKVPSLTAATKIIFHWGGAAPAEKPAATSTWTGYTGVWHMNVADSAAGTLEPDATGNGLDATPSRNPQGTNSRVEEIVPAPYGKIGNCVHNQNSGVTRNSLEVPPYWDKMDDVSVMTIGGWYRMGRPNSWSRLFSAKIGNGENTGWEAYFGSGSSTQLSACGSAGHQTLVDIPDILTTWVHVQYVFNGSTVRIYANGRLCGTVATTAIRARTDGVGFVIGATPEYRDAGAWCGYYDEVRMYNGTLSADRIKAEYDTSRDPVAFIKGTAPEHSVDLYTAGYQGSAPLESLPVQVVFPDCVPGFSLNDAAPDGSDIWFSDADGNPLAAECDGWRLASDFDRGKSVFWVKVPNVTKTTKITVHWGGTPPANRPAATSTWDGYVGVWHMGKAMGKPLVSEPDATGHGLAAVPSTTDPTTNKLAQVLTRNTGDNGLQGKITQIQSEAGRINGLKVPGYSSYITDYSRFTISGWFYADKANGYTRLVSSKNAWNEGMGWEIWHNNGVTGIGMTGSASTQVTVGTDSFLNNWMHLVAVYNGNSVTLYKDGQLIKTGNIVAAVARNDGAGFTIGGMGNLTDQSLYGCVDEVRLYNGVVSADRAIAEYATQQHPTHFLRPAPAGGSIVEEQPTYWNHFYGARNYLTTEGGKLCGSGAERLFINTIAGGVRLASPGGGAVSTTADGPYGKLTFGNGDWTYHVRAQTADLENGTIWCLGLVSDANVGLVLAANGTNGVSLLTATGKLPIAGSRLDASVENPTCGYHDYAVVFRSSTKVADLFVDGVLKGSLPHPNYVASNNGWQWLSNYGGIAEPFQRGYGTRIEETRFYRRALTTAELTSLHQWLSGDSAVHNSYTATVTKDMPFHELEWTPAPPAGGFTADDLLTVEFASPSKTLYLWDLPKVMRLTVRGCPDAAAGAAGRVLEMDSYSIWPSDVRFENGAYYDTNGNGNNTFEKEPYVTMGAGTALTNSRLPIGSGRSSQASGLALVPGATVSVGDNAEMGFIGYSYVPYWINLNGGRLVKRGSANLWCANNTIYGPGTFEVSEGKVTVFKTGFKAVGAELEVKPGATLEAQISGTVERLSGAGTVTVTGANVLTVTESLSGLLNVTETANSTNAVTVADGATMDFSQNTAPFAQPASMRYLGLVKVVPPGSQMYFGRKQLIAWAEPPADEAVEFVSEGTERPLRLSVEPNGLWIDMSGTMLFIR